MKKSLVLLALFALVACESSITVEDPDGTPLADDTPFLTVQDLAEDDAQDESDQVGPDGVAYPDFGLLEYYEQYGDNQQVCWGFEDPPQNNFKIDHCTFEMSYNTDRTFKVLYFEDGKPIPSQEIAWELVNALDPDTDQPIAQIDAKASGTNAEGVASVKVTTFDRVGQFALKAKAVSNKFSIPPLFFDIVVNPKSVEPLTVKLQYQGAAQPDPFKVFLFLQDEHSVPGCADLDPTGTLPIADKASGELTSTTQSAKFMGFADLTPDNPLMFTIIATGYDHNGPVLAYGCNDLEGMIEFGKSTIVTIVLKDVPPKYMGTYEVVNHFDMTSALPDDVEVVVNFIIDFLNSPSAGLMSLTCLLKDQASVLEDLCKNFFNDPDDPDIEDLSFIGGIVQQVVDAILYSLLKDSVYGDILFTAKDVGNILREVEIHSTIKIKQEPDATGYIPMEATEEEWHTLTLQWTLGEDCNPTDPDCGLKSFSFNAIGQDVVVSQFEARIALNMDQFANQSIFDKLVIYRHPLNFKYGAFLNFMIEKFVLPMVAGDGSDNLPVVDSYEKFFMSLVGGKVCLQANNCCTVFAESIAAQAGDWTKSMIKSGCDILIPLAADYLRDFLLGLDADTGDTFTLSTKGEDGNQGASPESAVPCTLYDDDNDQEIDKWGRQEPDTMRCQWDVLLKLGGTDVFFDADFWGTRAQ